MAIAQPKKKKPAQHKENPGRPGIIRLLKNLRGAKRPWNKQKKKAFGDPKGTNGHKNLRAFLRGK